MANISAPNDIKYVKAVSTKAKIIGGIVNVLSTSIFFATLAAIIAFIILLDHEPDILYEITPDYFVNDVGLSKGDAAFLLFPRDFYLKFDWLVITACIVSAITSLVSFIFMMRAAAHTKSGELKPSRFDRIPFEIVLCIIIAAVMLFALITHMSMLYINDGGSYQNVIEQHEKFGKIYRSIYTPPTYGVRIFGAVLILDVIMAFTLSLTFLYTICARIKTRTLIKNTIVYRILRLLFRIIRWIYRNTVKRFFNALRFVIKNLPATWYYVLTLVGYSFINFFLLIIPLYELTYVRGAGIYRLTLLALFLIFNAVSLYLVIRTASSFKLVQQAAKLMASGDLRYKIATHSLRG
ncbi:MAG: hypothetical protein IKL81_03045, partial [Clostridia bacterium]|nr:hypothetical protein [Clostridia bacterium]